MSHDLPAAETSPPTGPFAWYHRTPLYLRIIVALILGIIAGELMGAKGAYFKPFSQVVLRLLGALATPLIFVAVVQSIYKAKVSGKTAARLLSFLFLNTVVAILVGLLVANTIQPGHHVDIKIEKQTVTQKPFDPLEDLLGKIPGSVLKPLAENDIMSVILIALALGVGLRTLRSRTKDLEKTALPSIERFLDTAFQLVMV